MNNIIRKWIVEILEQHKQLLAIAVRQRAKFEGWLKFELAVIAEKNAAQKVEVESISDVKRNSGGRSDLSLIYNGKRYDIELKTANTNYRIPGVHNKHRPITKNISGIIQDAKKLSQSPNNGIIVFILFPIPHHDNRWTKYIIRINSELGIFLLEGNNCNRLSIGLGGNQLADLVVCSFKINNHTSKIVNTESILKQNFP